MRPISLFPCGIFSPRDLSILVSPIVTEKKRERKDFQGGLRDTEKIVLETMFLKFVGAANADTLFCSRFNLQICASGSALQKLCRTLVKCKRNAVRKEIFRSLRAVQWRILLSDGGASTRVSICYDTRNNKERLFRTSATNYNLN